MFSRLDLFKPMPHFIQDFGCYGERTEYIMKDERYDGYKKIRKTIKEILISNKNKKVKKKIKKLTK